MSQGGSIRRFQLLIVVFSLSLPIWQPLLVRGQEDSEGKKDSVELYTDADSYEIYAVLLSRDNHPLYVIQAETNWYPNTTAKDLGMKGGRRFMRDWKEVMQDAARQDRTPKLLTNSLSMNVPYKLLTKSEQAEIFRFKTPTPNWDSFYQRYPSSGGYYAFSAVGFNRQRNRAIVEMGHKCGPACGADRPYFFEKQGGTWHEVSVEASITIGAF